MQLKMQTDYAVRILLFLSSAHGLVTMQELSERLGITKTTIPRTLHMLRRGGLVRSESGISGGYRLAKPPGSITLLDVMELSEDSIKINRCLEEDRFCSRNAAGHCAVHDIYAGYQEMAERYFGSITIADLLEKDAAAKLQARARNSLKAGAGG